MKRVGSWKWEVGSFQSILRKVDKKFQNLNPDATRSNSSSIANL
jgi:hypothetical protein